MVLKLEQLPASRVGVGGSVSGRGKVRRGQEPRVLPCAQGWLHLPIRTQANINRREEKTDTEKSGEPGGLARHAQNTQVTAVFSEHSENGKGMDYAQSVSREDRGLRLER